ncbi:hypothetical protein BBF96_07320 [Anoxybacter fermentans]|uniref:N-acetyltransferase domain-containing protein n=1 Tax=Anoxybacter fermentans TaxID=1323375 RepID=A0A3Q9HQA8_9FIRM|nr:GNAT family N-acetyltransferase [Anoxybacter fermentans]AZR73210.1 hypothetical protein BBF96_07320 [Anoxybacter fermentans]
MQFRRATFTDKKRIIEICSNIWEGDDYIPNILDQWIADDKGEFTVLVEDGQIMGMGKLTFAEPGVGWLEGLRVAPEARGRGYAREITRYFIRKGREMGFDRLQLSTYYQNDASIHIIESYGFKRIADFYYAEQKVNPTKNLFRDEVMQATLNGVDYEELVQLFLNAPEQKVVNGFIGLGWFFKKLKKEELNNAIKRGHIYYLKKDGQIVGGIFIYPDHKKDNSYYIPMVTGTDEAITALLQWVYEDAVRRGFKTLAAMIPNDSRLKSIYLDQGFKHWEEGIDANVFVYELKLRGGDE